MVRNSKIIVAGGSGFIGTNLISELIDLGNEVISISKTRGNIKRNFKNVKYIFHDLKKPLKKEVIPLLNDVEYIVNCSGYIDHRNFKNNGKIVFDDHISTLFTLTNLLQDLLM